MVKLNKDKQEIRHIPFALLSITAAGNQQKKEFACKHYILHHLLKREDLKYFTVQKTYKLQIVFG